MTCSKATREENKEARIKIYPRHPRVSREETKLLSYHVCFLLLLLPVSHHDIDRPHHSAHVNVPFLIQRFVFLVGDERFPFLTVNRALFDNEKANTRHQAMHKQLFTGHSQQNMLGKREAADVRFTLFGE